MLVEIFSLALVGLAVFLAAGSRASYVRSENGMMNDFGLFFEDWERWLLTQTPSNTAFLKQYDLMLDKLEAVNATLTSGDVHDGMGEAEGLVRAILDCKNLKAGRDTQTTLNRIVSHPEAVLKDMLSWNTRYGRVSKELVLVNLFHKYFGPTVVPKVSTPMRILVAARYGEHDTNLRTRLTLLDPVTSEDAWYMRMTHNPYVGCDTRIPVVFDGMEVERARPFSELIDAVSDLVGTGLTDYVTWLMCGVDDDGEENLHPFNSQAPWSMLYHAEWTPDVPEKIANHLRRLYNATEHFEEMMDEGRHVVDFNEHGGIGLNYSPIVVSVEASFLA